MNPLDQVTVLLPSLDPDDKLLSVVSGLLNVGFSDILLINDGSKTENLHYFEKAAVHPQVHLLHHPRNMGKGAALKTGLRWFLENRPNAKGVVTVDGDNQHHPDDIQTCTLKMLGTGRIILGCRDFSMDHVPLRSRAGNNITKAVFRIFCGMKLSDTQTGLRAIPTAYIQQLEAIKGDRFEYETNMLLAMLQQDIPYGEVQIRTVYIEENKSSHFRAVQDSARIYALILAHFFRYTLASIASALVDTGVFALLSWLLSGTLGGLLLNGICTGTARVLSSLFNFFVNKKMVFQNEDRTGKALLRYYCLAIPILLLQLGLTHGAYLLFGIEDHQTLLRTLIYVAVMTVLYIVSFMFQQRWVFRTTSKERD
jgi:glycosyltransferase involved in cell wall biosynthesis